jgi:putative DNA methylase
VSERQPTVTAGTASFRREGVQPPPTHAARKLIEVVLPLDAMNRAGRAEKSVPRKGLPATMHPWWSRKPTGVARAVLFASLVDDPMARSDLWPDARERADRRQALVDLVADLSRWDCEATRVDDARRILSEEYGAEPPTVLDPFCGGGAIPYAATGLGLPNLGVDLNPVAALLTKAMVEIPMAVAGLGPVHPHGRSPLGHGSGMGGVAADIESYGQDLLVEVERRLGPSYPAAQALDGSMTRAVSYLWARTCRCVNPACGAEVPMLSTWWLSKRPKNHWHVTPRLTEARVEFRVVRGPKPDSLQDPKVGQGANFRCLKCGEVTAAEEIRRQGCDGKLGLRLVAIQTTADPAHPRGGRAWTNATPEQEAAGTGAWPAAREFPFHDYPLPGVAGNIRSFGIDTIADLLTPRQRLLMVTMCDVLADVRARIEHDARSVGLDDNSEPLQSGGTGALAYSHAITTYLAIAISRMANRVSTMTIHNRANGSVEQSFVQPAFAFYGEFAEAHPFSGSTGSWGNSLKHVAAAAGRLPVGPRAEVRCGSALTELQSVTGIVSTDPPYYDMFDYAALSNLYYPWLRLALRDIWPDETSTLVPSDREQIVSNPARFGGDRARAQEHFERLLAQAFRLIRKAQIDECPLTLYYGYQQSERRMEGRSSTAWESLLSALIAAGFTIVRTWPLRTERPEGVKSGSNSLASSILLVCRKRPDDARSVTRADFLTALRSQLPDEVAELRAINTAPVDLAQSVIGPGMAVYTSFGRVLEADGSPMPVRIALELINQVLDEVLEGHESELDAETRWAVKWFSQFGFDAGPFGDAETLCKATGTAVDGMQRSGIVESRASKVWLVGREDLPGEWDPLSDGRVPVWEATQHLVKALDEGGEAAAAGLLSRLGGVGETARDLAYRLYAICDQKKWAKEAGAYNALVTSWPEIRRKASTGTVGQGSLLGSEERDR